MDACKMEERKEEEKVQDIVDKGTISLGIDVGITTGLYRAFEKHNRKCKSEDLAKTAGLKERYVREWLGGMVAAELIYMNEKDEYILPISAEFIESQSKPYICRLMTNHFGQFLDVIKEDSSKVGYGIYDVKGVYEFLASERDKPGSAWYIGGSFVEDEIEPVVNWAKKESDVIRLMDLGCGSGAVSFEIAKRIPDIQIVGIDENESVIASANKRAKTDKVTNCSFEHCKGEDMADKYTGSIDIVLMMDVLHDMADSDKCMQSIRKILKPGGYIIAFDPSIHSDPRCNKGNLTCSGFYFISLFTCLPNSLSRDAAIGHGMGWGYENRKKYIEEWGFTICKLTEEEDVNEMKMRIIGKMN